MKRIATILAIILTFALGGTLLYFKGKRYEIVIPQEKIDAELSSRFPITKNHLLIFSITYSNPQVTLLENKDRVQVGLDTILNIRINGEQKNLGGGATVTSAIRYENESQEFFLDDAEFNRLEIQGVPDIWMMQVKEFADKAARELIETTPIYRLEAKDGKTAAAKLLFKGFEIHDQAIYVSLGI